MKQTIGVIAVLGVMLIAPLSVTEAQTTENPDMQATIAALLEQVQVLQQQLAELRGEVQTVREEIRMQLREGMTGEEVEKLQALLASDPEIYPEGLQTGYFGGLTRSALARFQARHELPVTGEVDEATKELLNEYFKERGNGEIPPGLLRAPGIRDKVERRLANDCDDARGMAFLCERLKGKYGEDKKPEKGRGKDDDEEDSEDELEIEVEVKDGEAEVKIEYTDGSEIEYTISGEDVDIMSEDALIAAIAAEKDLTEEEVAAVIEIEYEDEDEDDEDEEDDDEEDEDDEDDESDEEEN